MMKQFKITTNDNPFDPFEDYDNWFLYDIEKGWYSNSKLNRLANVQDDMTEIEYNVEIERAIDEIVRLDFTDTYKKAVKEYPDLEDSSDDSDLDNLGNIDEEPYTTTTV
jgi:hypothetical protein